MNDLREKIVQIVARKGPVLPVEIMKEVGGNTIIIGAMLSELASKDRVKITNSKVGGSPLYYVIGQEPKLVSLYGSMNDKDKKSFDALKKEGVLRDVDLTPIMRVSLRSIRDFAKPLEVTVAGHTEIFWRWFLLPMKDAESRIREILNASKDLGVKKKTRSGKTRKASRRSVQGQKKRPGKTQAGEQKKARKAGILKKVQGKSRRLKNQKAGQSRRIRKSLKSSKRSKTQDLRDSKKRKK